jgi:hypothetical protein
MVIRVKDRKRDVLPVRQLAHGILLLNLREYYSLGTSNRNVVPTIVEGPVSKP